MEILQFHPAHVEVAVLTDHEDRNFKRVPNSFQTLIALNQKSMQAVTVMLDGRILLMCGFIKLWPGVVEVWMIPTVWMEQSKIEVCKSVKRFLDITAESMNLHRMQALAIDDEKHTKFMEFLGFEHEGTLKEYSDQKEDFKQWSKLFKEKAA